MLGMTSAAAKPSELPSMLIVGRYRFGDVYKLPAVRSDGYHFVDIADLSVETVRKITPDVVLSALIGNGFDATEIAQVLEAAGFPGRYRVISDPVESSGLIVQEVTRLAPSVDFEILELAPELLQTMAL